jgi:uncharacterized protein YqjF (DUF2071 family)
MGHHDFDTTILENTAHRPWKMPDRPWIMTQTWHDLLFAHWTIDPAQLGTKVPAAFELDLFDGKAWVGIVPFRMSNVAPRAVPSLPLISEFPELNVRTYVRVGNRPGVYFFSLDAGSTFAVRAARAFLNLPYHSAAMTVSAKGDSIEYTSRRKAQPSAAFDATYAPAGPAFTPQPGTLDYFLTERYCLYHSSRSGVPYRMDIHHPLWALHPAQAEIGRNTMATISGLSLDDRPPLLHFAKRQDMVAWMPSSLNDE